MSEVWLFLIAAMTLTLAPELDNIYVLMCGITRGRKAGLVAALGFSFGMIFHAMLALLDFVAPIKGFASGLLAIMLRRRRLPDLYWFAHLAFACCCVLARQCRAAEADACLMTKRDCQHVESESDAVLNRIFTAVR